MAQKKDRNLDLPFRPPSVVVRLIDEGSNLDKALKRLNEASSAEERAARDAIDIQRKKLQPVVERARAALVLLGAFEQSHAADLKMLRSLSFDAVRNIVDEAVRVRTENRVRDLFKLLANTRDILATIEYRADALVPGDLVGPRMNSDAPGIHTYDDLPPAAVARIELDAEGAARVVAHLADFLKATQHEVETLAAALAKKQKIRGDVTSSPNGPTIRSPEQMAQARAGRPEPEQDTADAEFSGYSADNN